MGDQEQAKPFELDRTIELVRAAFMEAMHEHGIFLGTRIAISARAELNIAKALQHDETKDLAGDGDLK
jgi:hypothetical protein